MMMTDKEFFTAIVNSSLSYSVRNYAKEQLDGILAKEALINAIEKLETAYQKEIVSLLQKNTSMFVTEIAQQLNISTPKVAGLCCILVKEGILKYEMVKVRGKGVMRAYSLCD